MSEKTKEAEAVDAAVDAIKLTMALATGTLVFSAELLKEDVEIGSISKVLLVVSWCLLGISILAGALAYLSVPVMIHEGKPNIGNKFLCIPGLIHHVAFLAGVLVLGLAMVLILAAKNPKSASANSALPETAVSASTNALPK
jgi:hypothetical protein